jgi:hypothetical protein
MASPAAGKTDLKRDLKALYAPKNQEPHLVTVPALTFLMVDGVGDPNGSAFAEAVGALYSVAYGLKFAIKKAVGTDYTVMPLEALWGYEDRDASGDDRATWPWTAMIAQPEPVPDGLLTDTIAKAKAKEANQALDRVRLAVFEEGEAAQVLHIGPYSAEAPNIERLHAFVADQGLRLRGRHHEVYIGDPRRTAPEKLKTVLRHPIERVIDLAR